MPEIIRYESIRHSLQKKGIFDKNLKNIIEGLNLEWEVQGKILVPKETSLYPKKRTIVYPDIYKGSNTIQILSTELSDLDDLELISRLASINFFLSTNHESTQIKLIRNLVPKQYQAMYDSLFQQENGNIALAYETQLLYLIRLSLLHSKKHTSGNKEIDSEVLHRILLRASDIIGQTYPILDDGESPSTPAGKKFSATLLRDIYLQHHHQFRYALTRYWLIFHEHLPKAYAKFPNEAIDIVKTFEKVKKMDHKIYMGIAFGIWTFFEFDNRLMAIRPSRFKVKQSVQTQLRVTLDELSKTKDELSAIFAEPRLSVKDQELNYQPIYDYPLLKLDNETYLPLSRHFLESKVSNGIYWAVHNYYLDQERNDVIGAKTLRKRVQGIWGRAIELYIYDIFERILRGTQGELFYGYDADIGTDILITVNDTVFLIEVTTQTLTHATLVSADPDKLETELRKLFCRKDKKGRTKLEQFNNAIECAKKGKFPIEQLKGKKYEKIYPILIFERMPPFPGKVANLWWDIVKDSAGKNVREFSKLQLVNLEEAEMLEAFLLAKQYPLDQFWGRWERSAEFGESLKNYILLKHKGEHKNMFLSDKLTKEISPEIRDLLFKEAE